MTATYTFDIFSTLDGDGSYTAKADTGASKVPSSSTTALPCTAQEQRMVFGANTYRQFAQLLGPSTEPDELGSRTRSIRWSWSYSSEPRLAVVAITDRSVYLTVW